MPIINLHTEIKAEKEVVFDLSRSIDLHKISTEQTSEEAIAGKTSGLIGLHESVTWRAKHFGIYQNLTSKITKFDRSNYFVDEMVKGAFKGFVHEHHFSKIHTGTLMVDVGNLADTLFLKNYMTALLTERNRVLKEFAESKKWETLIRQ